MRIKKIKICNIVFFRILKKFPTQVVIRVTKTPTVATLQINHQKLIAYIKKALVQIKSLVERAYFKNKTMNPQALHQVKQYLAKSLPKLLKVLNAHRNQCVKSNLIANIVASYLIKVSI